MAFTNRTSDMTGHDVRDTVPVGLPV